MLVQEVRLDSLSPLSVRLFTLQCGYSGPLSKLQDMFTSEMCSAFA